MCPGLIPSVDPERGNREKGKKKREIKEHLRVSGREAGGFRPRPGGRGRERSIALGHETLIAFVGFRPETWRFSQTSPVSVETRRRMADPVLGVPEGLAPALRSMGTDGHRSAVARRIVGAR